MQHKGIRVKGIDLEVYYQVEGDYIRGYFDTPEDPEILIETVLWDGLDVTDLVLELIQDEIEEQLW